MYFLSFLLSAFYAPGSVRSTYYRAGLTKMSETCALSSRGQEGKVASRYNMKLIQAVVLKPQCAPHSLLGYILEHRHWPHH